MKVGFIGLGMMGSGMARNLIKAGHALVVFNRTRSRAQELAQLGATVAATPGEAAGSAEVLITMLADDHALEDAILGPGRRSEEHTSELQSRVDLVCRLLLEKKKK